MEMCKDIYANSEVITRRDQNKNSDYKTAGCYRWTTGGLLLLCVLLLPVIVVLTVKNDQLQTSNNNLTIENNQLQTSYNNLTIENKQLKKENDLSLTSYLDQGWIYYQYSVYIYTNEQKSWSASREDCKRRGADLVVINSEAEQMFIRRWFQNTTVWIGLKDIDKKRKYMWVDGTTLKTAFWKDGEPNNASKNEDCVETSYTDSYLKSWNDSPCNISCNGICEKRF